MAEPYDPQAIEPRWQETWARERFAAADTAQAAEARVETLRAAAQNLADGVVKDPANVREYGGLLSE